MRTPRALLVVLLLGLATVPVGAAGFPFEVTLEAPAYAPVGEAATFSGRFGALGLPAHALRVTLHVHGEAAGTDVPFLGRYEIPHAFPARGAYAVHAVADEGRPTEATSVTRTVVAAEPPTVPRDVLAQPLHGSVSVLVTWAAPEDDGGAPLTQYRVLRREGAGPWQLYGVLTPTTLHFQDDGLQLGRAYAYRVLAFNPVGASPAVEVDVTGDAPAAPTLTVTPNDGARTVAVEVAAGTGGATQSLTLQRSVDGGQSWSTLATRVGATLRTDSGVTLGSSPLYRAVARSLAGATTSDPVAPEGELPGLVPAVEVAAPWRLTVAWSPPADGGPVQGYRVFVDGAEVALAWPFQSHVNITTTPGTHAYQVAATSILGDGPRSAPVTFTLDAAGAPLSLVPTVHDGARRAAVNLTWAAPASDGGAPVTGYEVHRAVGTARTRIATVGPETLTWNDTWLADGRTYRYEVAAVTAAGPGEPALVDAVVQDYAWVLTHGLAAFHACETLGGIESCTDVPSGGTYHRQGTGSVRYAATFAGGLTRQGVPQEGEGVLVTMWQTGLDEQAESEAATTDAAGQYAAPWSGFTWTPGASCETVTVESWATDGWASPTTTDALTLCP